MKNNAYQERIKIIANNKISARYFKLTLNSAKITAHAQPGQFVEIRVADSDEPLLRRPLGIHRVKGDAFEILCEIVGRATAILSQRRNGEYLDIIGPLGNGFRLNGQTIIVAGGMGVAPLVFLAERLAVSKPLVLLGAKTKKSILCEKEFKKIGCDVKIATDDGSLGFKGKVTDLLRKLVSTVNCQLSTIYACGPRPMLKAIARISKKYKIPAQVSLEEHMACGIGVCLGCVVNTKKGMQRVCKEGPVFEAKEIIW
ncbi:MAG: dihydroorotate dehydrogenase electron transfer subunit [Candidatus Omnitrophota bacterium]|jgi:dihydroorotate dehydrogenase electron transfer subunit